MATPKKKNLAASVLATKRWAKATKEEKTAHALKMLAARAKKRKEKLDNLSKNNPSTLST